MRDVVTTAFEVAGLLLIAAAAGVWLFRIDPALGILGAGASLLAESGAVVALVRHQERRGQGDAS